ncbi:chemotaxis protein CheW [candidate division KSB1 bacterium]
MEILFFKLNNKLSGIFAEYLQEVVINAEPVPFLPVSDYVDRLLVHQGRVIGLIDLKKFFSFRRTVDSSGEIILVRYKEIEFGFIVDRVVQKLKVAKNRLSTPGKSPFIPIDYVGCDCKVGNRTVPIISPSKILLHKDLKNLWFSREFVENK